MKFIMPVAVTAAILTSSTLAEPSLSATEPSIWAINQAYAKDAYCIMTTTHKIYQCLVAVAINTNFPPNTSPTYWQEIVSTNAWRMFDAYGSSKSIAGSAQPSITITLTPGVIINAVAFIGLQYTDTVAISTNAGYSASIPATGKTDLVVTDLVAAATAVITITITGTTGKVGVGKVEIGNSFELGDINFGSSVGIIDYSTKVTNPWGDTTITKRNYTKRLTAKLTISNPNLDAVESKLAAYRSTAVVWIGNENLYTALIVYGYYRDFDINIAYPTQSDCSLTIEGVT